MKISSSTLYIVLYFFLFVFHFAIWKLYVPGFDIVFYRYYLFLTLLFMMVITILTIIKKIYPNQIGFAFIGLMMFKLMIMFIVMKKLELKVVPNYKFHFILPYLFSLLLETLYAVLLIKKDEKNQ